MKRLAKEVYADNILKEIMGEHKGIVLSREDMRLMLVDVHGLMVKNALAGIAVGIIGTLVIGATVMVVNEESKRKVKQVALILED